MSIGYRAGGRYYGFHIKPEASPDARAELVELASFAGKSATAFEFIKAQTLTLNDKHEDADNLYDAIVGGCVSADVPEPEDYIDFDAKTLVYVTQAGPATFELEWLGRGGVVELPEFMKGNVTGHSYGVEDSSAGIREEDDSDFTVTDMAGRQAPNVVSSEISRGPAYTNAEDDSVHLVLIDLDFESALIPSTTPGRYHLYVDKKMSKEKYSDFVKMLKEFGVVAQGNLNQIEKTGRTYLRMPWVRKGFSILRGEDLLPEDTFQIDSMLAKSVPAISVPPLLQTTT